ncbi:hypothetical protein RHS03_06725, partial [Rhizoctonia solani]
MYIQACSVDTDFASDDSPTPSINTLPTEVLILIFKFAHYLWWKGFKREHADWPAAGGGSTRKQMSLGHPEVLTHVCYLWRQIVFSSPALWSYIDLFALNQSPQLSLDRSSAFVARAENHELTLRVRLHHGIHESLSDFASIKDFCSFIGPRIGALQIDNNSPNYSTTLLSSIIRASLPRTMPGVLTKLDINDHSVRTISNFTENSDGLAGWTLPTPENFDMSQHSLDNILRSIKVLRLSGQFFPWTSPAYRGLVELHLRCTRPQYGHRPSIRITQLREILLASPGLRVFYFNINISQDVTIALPPVPLPELEVINLRGLKRSLYDLLLPLLSPAQKPLQMTIQTQRVVPSTLYCFALISFFRRTNVTSLYVVNRLASYPQLPLDMLVLESPASLNTLGLERFHVTGPEPSRRHSRPICRMKLNHLYLRKCAVDIYALENIAETFPIETLRFHDMLESSYDRELTHVHSKISSMFPSVKWVRWNRAMEAWGAWETEYLD